MTSTTHVQAMLPLARVAIIDRLRPVDEDWVTLLMVSLDERGLDQPIIVRPMPPVQGRDYALVAGLHRLMAAERLGWVDIRVEIQQLNDDAARLAEIDENLMRRELSVLDRGVFMAERKQVWERLHPSTKNGGDRRSISSQYVRSDFDADGDSQPKPLRFTLDAAERLRFSERSIQIAVLIGRIPPEVREELRGTPFENSTRQLHHLAFEHEDDQLPLARLLRSGEVKTVSEAKARLGLIEAKPAPEPDPEAIWKTLAKAWVEADEPTQKRFIKMLKATGAIR